MFSDFDKGWMRRALRLAAKGTTPPNPMVGCVLVKNGTVVGEGFHPVAGAPHAEQFALKSAGVAAKGATAYVTLEPCSHHGKTPPCADALISAGVVRVVAAMQDPNPKVAGRGIERLRNAGIEVQVGLLEQLAAELNADFVHFHRTGLPYVTLKVASSLDGRTATATGQSRWITGGSARRDVHKVRARSGAVLVGIGTVLADDPSLTVRGVPTQRQPLRVVLDSKLRILENSQLVRGAGEFQTLIFCSDTADKARASSLRQHGVDVVFVPRDAMGHPNLSSVLVELGMREVTGVMVEGGPEIWTSFLNAGLVNRILWYQAPVVIGGDGRSVLGSMNVQTMADALRLGTPKVCRFGPDTRFDWRVNLVP